MYGITVNTTNPVSESNPNRNGKFGLTYPAPGTGFFRTQKEANETFERVVKAMRAAGEKFTATLDDFRGETETIRRATENG